MPKKKLYLFNKVVNHKTVCGQPSFQPESHGITWMERINQFRGVSLTMSKVKMKNTFT